MTTAIDPIFLESQMSALKEYVEEQLGEEATVCLYSDGSMMIETPVTYDKNGRGFGFDSFNEMFEHLEEFRQ